MTSKLFVLNLSVFLAACIAPDPPPMTGTAADPQVRGSSPRPPRSLLARDETTRAIEKQLSLTADEAEAAKKMPHPMGSMPGTEHGTMPTMQPAQPPARSGLSTTPAVSGNSATGDYYTCPMHPEIHSNKRGNCPICGMQLIKKEADR